MVCVFIFWTRTTQYSGKWPTKVRCHEVLLICMPDQGPPIADYDPLRHNTILDVIERAGVLSTWAAIQQSPWFRHRGTANEPPIVTETTRSGFKGSDILQVYPQNTKQNTQSFTFQTFPQTYTQREMSSAHIQEVSAVNMHKSPCSRQHSHLFTTASETRGVLRFEETQRESWQEGRPLGESWHRGQ